MKIKFVATVNGYMLLQDDEQTMLINLDSLLNGDYIFGHQFYPDCADPTTINRGSVFGMRIIDFIRNRMKGEN